MTLRTVSLFCVVPALLCSYLATAQGASKPSLSVEVFTAADGVYPGESLRAAIVAKLGEGWHVNANKPLEEFLIPTELTVEPQEGFAVEETVYPEAKTVKLGFSENPLALYEGTFAIGLAVRVANTVVPGGYTLKGVVRYQACNDTQCFAPQKAPVEIPIQAVAVSQAVTPQHEDLFKAITFGGTAAAVAPSAPSDVSDPSDRSDVSDRSESNWRPLAARFEIAGEAGGYKNVAAFLAFLDNAEAGNAPREVGMFAGKSLWLVVLLTLAGGLALNLTPCVLPLIPINLAIIGAGARAGSRRRGFVLGGMYGLGMALVYGILGLAVVLTASTFGGGINASPWFNLGIAIIFTVLALAMFDLILIDFSRFQSSLGVKKKEGGSLVVAFVMGAIAALLAGACVAPVVIAVILFSRDLYAQGTSIALGLPFLLGVGMALPWPLAGAGLSLLPKPGKWMVRVKYVFGVVILAIALYYAYGAYGLFAARSESSRQQVTASTRALDKEGWLTSLTEGLKQAEQERKPVFIDFWATWCKNCLVMNETTFKDSAVKERLDKYVRVKYQAEFMDEAPAKDVVRHFNVIGLPSYVILHPKTVP